MVRARVTRIFLCAMLVHVRVLTLDLTICKYWIMAGNQIWFEHTKFNGTHNWDNMIVLPIVIIFTPRRWSPRIIVTRLSAVAVRTDSMTNFFPTTLTFVVCIYENNMCISRGYAVNKQLRARSMPHWRHYNFIDINSWLYKTDLFIIIIASEVCVYIVNV